MSVRAHAQGLRHARALVEAVREKVKAAPPGTYTPEEALRLAMDDISDALREIARLTS